MFKELGSSVGSFADKGLIIAAVVGVGFVTFKIVTASSSAGMVPSASGAGKVSKIDQGNENSKGVVK